MGRIIGIDFGTKRIGIAVTDPMQMIASPLTTVSNIEFMDFLSGYIRTEEVDAFVIGYPLQLNNEPSASVKYLKPFIRRLMKLFPGKPVHLIDERFTSGIAQRTILEGGVRKKDRQDKSLIDKISASLILQSFLEKRDKTRDAGM